MERQPSRELMDDGLSATDLPIVLDDLWRINRWYGGVSGSVRLLETFFRRTGPHPVRILDVGAGDGRLAAALAQCLNQRRISAEFVILDRHVAHLQHGARTALGLGRVAADALSLPFRSASFDVVMSNLFLHHFSGGAAKRVLCALAEVASQAVLINDLDRRWLPALLICYAPFLARHPISRLDGAASVRQAYTRSELLNLAEESKAGRPEWIRLPFFRHGLILWKAPVIR